MATEHQGVVPSQTSSDTYVSDNPKYFGAAEANPEPTEKLAKHEENYDNIEYPPPWKWEKYFVGGYSQSRMFKFKNPNNMYKAINIFAGVAIMFYGYDQGVMSQVNLNEDYWNRSKCSLL